MTKNEITSLISIMSYVQGVCDAKDSRKAADMLQEGIDMLIEKIIEKTGENPDGACFDCKNSGTYLDKEPCLSCRPTNWEAKGEDE